MGKIQTWKFRLNYSFVKMLNIVKILVIGFLITAIFGEEDYYAILGIEKDASNKEIRKAFKKIALEKHPDKNQVIYSKLKRILSRHIGIWEYRYNI